MGGERKNCSTALGERYLALSAINYSLPCTDRVLSLPARLLLQSRCPASRLVHRKPHFILFPPLSIQFPALFRSPNSLLSTFAGQDVHTQSHSGSTLMAPSRPDPAAAPDPASTPLPVTLASPLPSTAPTPPTAAPPPAWPSGPPTAPLTLPPPMLPPSRFVYLTKVIPSGRLPYS